jgi:hypothetical protein
MTILYNCKHSGDQYQITKFDEHMNVESSYTCTERECDCPAGQRPRCRHREMLPKFISRGAIGTGWFFDYDRGGWVQMYDEPEPLTIATYTELPADADVVEEFAKLLHPRPVPTKSWRRF